MDFANLEACLGSGRNLELAHPQGYPSVPLSILFCFSIYPFWFDEGQVFELQELQFEFNWFLVDSIACKHIVEISMFCLTAATTIFVMCGSNQNFLSVRRRLILFIFLELQHCQGQEADPLLHHHGRLMQDGNLLFQKYQLWRPPKTGSFFIVENQCRI